MFENNENAKNNEAIKVGMRNLKREKLCHPTYRRLLKI